MKIFAAIFAISIVYMSFMPCGDDLFAESCSSEVSHHHPPGESPDDHENSDFCSPFCICSCCKTHIVTLDMTMEEAIVVVPFHVKNDTEPYMIDQEAVFEYWHPPDV